MRTLAPSAVSALSAKVIALVCLVKLDFPSVPILLASSNANIQAPSGLYRGAAGLGQVSQIDDSPGEIKGLQFALSGVPTEYIALALSEDSEVQGAPVTIRTGIIDGVTHALCDEPIVWQGRLDTMSIEEDGETCTIAATAESTAVDLLRGNPLTYSDADQQMLFPGDYAFGFIVSQANKPIVWPDKQWFQAKG